MARARKGATCRETAGDKPRLPLYLLAILLLVPLGLGVLVWGGAHLFDPKTLPVNTVRIESPLQQLDQAAVRNAVLPHAKVGFLRVDVAAIRAELEALPWVAKSSVRRAWPDRLVVRISEQQAMARWDSGGLLNPEGERFAVNDSAVWQDLPLLRGPKQTEKVLMKEYRAMQRALEPLGLNITQLSMDQRRAWNLYLDNGLQLRLGRNDSHLRLQRFVRVYAGVLQPRLKTIDSVDLRYTNGFAVRWREGKAAA
ncbi:MAG: cell division protein FtsQ/DivIB [Gammaproteobacteria bacterium]|nr:cell division protein FtsQ/DivIB [Gammaproteobacteria bacterium]MCW9088045.1 cell division protein FtsQ/DivIB [Gammaproteobacteria bacterium]